MIALRTIAAAGLAAVLSAGNATMAGAQAPLTPSAPFPRDMSGPPAADEGASRSSRGRPKRQEPAVTNGGATQRPREPPAPKADNAFAPAGSGEIDYAYGAYQRGYYLTAFGLATQKIEATRDVKSMTLLGQLYANGFGVAQDDNKADEWYRLAAERGDREAIFALAMFRLGGRAGPANRQESAALLERAAKLGHVAAQYDLGLLYLAGEVFPQDFARAADLLRSAAEAGSPEAQYALATFYKEGRGVAKDVNEAARWLSAAAAADNTDAQVEFAIALFNGLGVRKDEATAAALLKRAARKGSPIAQNRLAWILAVGRGVPADPVEAIKWHLVSKAGGESDLRLDEFMDKQAADVRAAGEKAAKPFLDAIKASHS
jgi:TPR repeat protein